MPRLSDGDLGLARKMWGDGHDGRLYHLRGFVDEMAVLRWWRSSHYGWQYVLADPRKFRLGTYWWERAPEHFPDDWPDSARREAADTDKDVTP